ncbi:hypothetical protein RN001_007443 [Aquatica leii]|uniref:4'-phosphopantetheine phosphatase n=1 Tax=Aquatica leii TaxID=1421715 RepID=A0AAN7P8B7_9COLE|nr:hypothetical protein RN001_007443 [Aquatica leii]
MMKDKKIICPLLLDQETYSPDTIDLLNNVDAINYWLPCLEEMARKFVSKVSLLNPHDKTATERANYSWQKFHDLIEKIKYNPDLFKPLSIRTLLEFNEESLRNSNFHDAWFLQKEKETTAAFAQYEDRINCVDSIEDFYLKWEELAKGLVAGNLFDWGAKAIADILEECNGFGLKQAMQKIQQRPWFHDDLDKWINRLEDASYRKAVIFIDNAGVDFVLGVLPFIRQLLKQGTDVVLTANSSPALNDVTCNDLKLYLKIAEQKCSVIKNAIVNNRLIGIENGQKGPCLDLRNLDSDLCQQMQSADLLILEGMGRAVHTNLNAKFKVDCLKLAVLKNEWLAKNLGAQQFSVIFQYDPAPEISI